MTTIPDYHALNLRKTAVLLVLVLVGNGLVRTKNLTPVRCERQRYPYAAWAAEVVSIPLEVGETRNVGGPQPPWGVFL
jgi:hypothetical protein